MINFRNKIKFAILFLFVLVSSASAQIDKNGGSIYSIFGLGDLSYSSSNRTDAMGIMGISLYGDYTNSVNPAAWTKIQNTIFSTRFTLDNIKSTDGTNTAKRTYGNFEGFDLSIPLNKGNGWIINLGINNYSLVNYDAKFSSSVGGENYTQSYSGNGGLYRMSVGFSYIIFKQFSFGTQFNYAFGNINKTLNIDFTNPLLYDTKNISSNTINGIYFNTGLIYHGFGKLFRSKKLEDMTLGVFVSTPAKFNSDVNGKFSRSIAATDTLTLTTGKLDIPLAFGVGFSNTFNKTLLIAADVYFQQWDNYKYYGVHPVEIKNSMKVGMGLEYTPSVKLEDPFVKRVSYRLGGSYTQEYLKINGENINTLSLSAGISLPIGKYNSVDLFIKYNMRGKDTNGLIKDNVFRFGGSVKIGELWFLKPSDEF